MHSFRFYFPETARPSHLRALTARNWVNGHGAEQLNDSQAGVYMYDDNGDVKLAHALFFLFLSPRGHSH